MRHPHTAKCPFCGSRQPAVRLKAAGWLAPPLLAQLIESQRGWRPTDGACRKCVRAILEKELARLALSPIHSHRPAWECLPTPFRMSADPRFTGTGATMAMIDSGFFPHPDLVQPRNRIRAWVDAVAPRVRCRQFKASDSPHWPGWDKLAPAQWHGQMASSIAAGNGRLSRGLFRGIAPDADVVLIETMDARHKITNATLAKALRWLIRHGEALNVKIVNFSVAGDPLEPSARNVVDAACERLLEQGVTLVAAVGNSAKRHLVTPSTCPGVIVVGGIDDHDRIDPRCWTLWNSNYGNATDGSPKPDLLAPSWRVVAPILPGSSVAIEAKKLFEARLGGDESVEPRINDQKMVTPYYQHMDGTSVAAPIVSATAACMLQAHPGLNPGRIRELLMKSCRALPNAPTERQGAGVLNAGRAVAAALADRFNDSDLA